MEQFQRRRFSKELLCFHVCFFSSPRHGAAYGSITVGKESTVDWSIKEVLRQLDKQVPYGTACHGVPTSAPTQHTHGLYYTAKCCPCKSCCSWL